MQKLNTEKYWEWEELKCLSVLYIYSVMQDDKGVQIKC